MNLLPLPNENDRRTELMEHLSAFVRLGITQEVAKREKDMLTGKPMRERLRHLKLSQISYLSTTVLKNTLAMLDSYSTETLEHVAQSFGVVSGNYDYLHTWLSYDGPEWNKVTGEHRDEMFRDIVTLRRYGWSMGWNRVHSLMETYRVLELEPGSISVMPSDDMHMTVAPVFKTACASRTVLWLRMGPAERRTDGKGNFIAPVEPEVPLEYKRQHLTSAAVEYVAGSHERYLSLWEYMEMKRETLYEVDFEYFLLQQGAHPSLRDGVL